MGNDGFLTGLKLWLIFFIAFFLLGYDIPLSIILGAIAGVAGSTIAAAMATLKVPKQLLPPRPSEQSASGRKGFGFREKAKQWAWIPWFGRRSDRS